MTPLVRTPEQIVERIREMDSRKLFGFHAEVLVPFLDYAHARPMLKAGTPESEWNDLRSEQSRETVLSELARYHDFAVGKAVDHRGLSAIRSVDKLQAWVWLLGDEDYEAIEWETYAQYGAPILQAIAERFDLPVPDDEGWRRMAAGERCRPGCEDGCE